MKNISIALSSLVLVGLSVNAVAETSAPTPQDQINDRAAILKTIDQTDSGDLFTDAIIGSEISADDYSSMLIKANINIRSLPKCPRCRFTVSSRIGRCRANGRVFSCSRRRN